MMMKCPNCGETAMPWYKKAFLGSARVVNCQHCDSKIGVPPQATLIAGFPVLIALGIGIFAGVDNTLALVLIGALFAIPAQVIIVPLILRD